VILARAGNAAVAPDQLGVPGDEVGLNESRGSGGDALAQRVGIDLHTEAAGDQLIEKPPAELECRHRGDLAAHLHMIRRQAQGLGPQPEEPLHHGVLRGTLIRPVEREVR
jgi:hypothetical protein